MPACLVFRAAPSPTCRLTIGAGLVQDCEQCHVKAEYLFVDLADYNCGFNCALWQTETVFYANVFRAGLNVRF